MLATETKPDEPATVVFPSKGDLLTLCRAEGPCVSILLSPHVAGTGTRSSGALMMAMLPQVEAALQERGMHAQDAAKMMKPLSAMVTETLLQASHRDGFCIYRSPRELHCFSVRAVVEPGWHVEERFIVSPVLAHLDYRQSFLLLALADKHIRLLRCEGGEATVLPIPDGVPESAAEFSGEATGVDHAKNHAPGVRFGSSDGQEKSGHFRRDFMKAIDRGLQPLLRAQRLPLVLAGVEEETAAYLAVSDFVELLPEPVQTSPDGGATNAELAEAGARIMKRWSSAAEQQALAEFQHAAPGRRRGDYSGILQAATQGRIQHLFVERGGRMTGDARRMAGLAAGPGYVYRADDLVNAAAVEVLLHKGMVWLLEPEQMPVASVMAAVLRYAGDTTGQ
jgi:hypothetical protein